MKLKHLLLLLMTVVSFSTVRTKAQTYQKYDASTCYSKILIDAKINDFAGNTKPMGFGSYNSKTGTITQPVWYDEKGNKRDLVMDYVAGLVAKACIEAADYYKDFSWSKPWFKLIENYATSVSVPKTGTSLDDLNASKMYFALAELTKPGAKYANPDTYAKAIAELKNAVTGLTAVNNNFSIRNSSSVNYGYDTNGNLLSTVVKDNTGKTELTPASTGMNAIGGWYHKATYPNQMWCDSEYMGPALLAQLVAYATSNPDAKIGTVTTSTNDDWKLIAKQFDITWNYLWNSKDQLLYHGFSATPKALAAHTYTWATGTNGTNAAYWGRAIGWYFLALVDVLENMPENITDDSYTKTQTNLSSRNANIKTRLKSYLTDLAAGIWARKESGSGLWTNVINEAVNKEHSTYATTSDKIQKNTTNYLEASASAIYIAAYIKAMRLGLLPSDTYKSDIETAYKNYISNFITTDNKIINTCASAGLGGGSVNIDSEQTDYKSGGKKYRDGTADYYTRGYDVTKVTGYQEGKPLGAFILASTEYERFMKDNYAPSFTDANSEKPAAQTITKGQSVTLHAAAMAKPTATYQWYSYSATEAAAASYATRATTTGTKIEGATRSDLTVTPDANTYYYCVATNEKGTAQTDAVLVTVNAASNEVVSKSDVIATFENLTSTAPTPWTATENTGFTVFGIGITKDYLKSGLYAVKMNHGKDNPEKATTITLNVPVGYTVTSLKITAISNSTSGSPKITVNNTDEVTIEKTNTAYKEYEVPLTEPVTGSSTISITNSGDKELGISKIVVVGYQGTPSSLSITTQPVGATYDVGAPNVTPLSVTVKKSGIDSDIVYQWYSNTTNSTEGGTLIQNGSSSTYTPPVTTAGTTYYYCIASAGGLSVTSNVVAVTVLNPSDLKTKYDAAWTPIANGTIEVGNLVTSSSTGAYSITSGTDVATISGTTITALKAGTFTLSQAADGTYSSGSKEITVRIGTDVTDNTKNSYNFTAQTAVSDGMKITLKDITMTFGNDGFWSQPSADSYTGGQVNPTVPANNIPTAGTFYKFTPTTTGKLAVKVKLGTYENKLRPLYVSENGTFITAKLENGTEVGKGETPAATAPYEDNIKFTVKANTDYYVYVPGSKLGFYGFTFTPVTLYTVTFNAGSNGTCDTKSIMQESENATITLPSVTANNGYTFDGWYTEATGGTKEGDAGATYTPKGNITLYAHYTSTSTGGGETGNVVTKTGTFPRSDMKTFDGKPDSANGEVSSISKNANGETVSTGGVLTLSSESPNVQAQQNDKGTKVRLGGSFTITAATGYKIKSIELVTDQSSRHLTSAPAVEPGQSGTNFTYNFTEGQQSVTFTNNNSANIYVGVINVTYEYTASGNKTPLNISFSDSQIERFTGETFPLTPTVTANGTTDVSGKYTVTYKSNNTDIATVNDNNVTLIKEGTVAITATVEPKADYASLYEGGSAVITVVSKAYTPLTVSVADVMMNSNDDVQTNPDVKVYLNDALVATSNYTVSYVVTSGSNVTASGSTLTVGGSAGSYTAGTSVITVTVTPTDAFKSANHCAAGTGTFSYVVNEAGTKLIPVIDFPGAITLGTNVTQTLISYVKYNGVDVTNLFTKTYAITEDTQSSGASFTNTTTGEFKTGSTEATVKIKITVTPKTGYDDQYDSAEKEVTVTIKNLTELTISQPADMTVKVGDVLDMPSFTITEKTSGNAVSSDDLEFVINSSSTSVVTVSSDLSKLYAVGAGTATIIVLAKDNTGQSKYMDATTSFKVTVTDPSLHIVEKGATASNGQCITDVPNVYMTYGGWVFKENHTTFLGKQYGSKKWNAAATDAAGAPVGFPYAVMGNGHEDSRDELGASASPEGKTIDYQSKGFELTDKMFSVPAEGAYFVFTPKVNGTVVAHVLQNGVFDTGYDNSKKKHAPSYKPNRRVFVVDEGGNRMPDTDIIAHLDVTTGVPKASESDKGTINGIDYNFSKNDKILNVGLYKTDYKDANEKTIYLSKNYVFDGGNGTIDGGIEGFKPTFDEKGNINNFQNKIYKRKVNQGKDEVEGGYVVLSKAPVTYTFKVKAGKSYYLYCFGSKLSLYGYEFKADETVTEDVVNLSETTAPTLSVTAEGHMAKVSLDRTFKAGIWNACVLPFSLNQYQVDAIFGKTYDKGHTDGTQILYFDRVEGTKMYFVRHAYNHIVAGKPFLIKPTNENAKINTADIEAFPYVTIEATTQPAAFGKGNDYKWESSYAPFGVEQGDYFLRDTDVNKKPADGNMVRYPAALTTNLSMNGFRGYLKAQTDGVRKSTKSMSIVIGSVDDDETTLIENVVFDEDGTLRPALKGKVYNIQGQLMTTDASRLNTLPKGIYIINGSKITVE